MGASFRAVYCTWSLVLVASCGNRSPLDMDFETRAEGGASSQPGDGQGGLASSPPERGGTAATTMGGTGVGAASAKGGNGGTSAGGTSMQGGSTSTQGGTAGAVNRGGSTTTQGGLSNGGVTSAGTTSKGGTSAAGALSQGGSTTTQGGTAGALNQGGSTTTQGGTAGALNQGGSTTTQGGTAGVAGQGGEPQTPVKVSRYGGYLDVRIELGASSLGIRGIGITATRPNSSAVDSLGWLARSTNDIWELHVPLCLHPALYDCSVHFDPCEYVRVRGTTLEMVIPLAYAHLLAADDIIVRLDDATLPPARIVNEPLPDLGGERFCPGGAYVPGTRSDFAAIAKPIDSRIGGGCALSAAGSLECWGDLLAPTGPFTQLAGVEAGICALGSLGIPTCWGKRDGSLAPPPSIPLATGEHVLQLSENGMCAILSSGSVRCWSDSGSFDHTGQFLSLSGNSRRGCAIDANSEIGCWGFESEYYWQSVPPAPRLGSGFIDVAVTDKVVCARRSNGEVLCVTPWESVVLDKSNFQDLTETSSCICAIDTDGTPTCMGNGCSVQPGLKVIDQRSGPETQASHLALSSSGKLAAWPNWAALP